MKRVLLVAILILAMIPAVHASPVQSWDNSCELPENWQDYIYNEWLLKFWKTWGGTIGDDKYRGWADLNKDGVIDILDAGTLNWMIVQPLYGMGNCA